MKKLIIPLIVIVLAGAGVFVFTQKKPQKQENISQTASSKDETTGMSSIKELLALGKTQSCIYEYTDTETGTTKGTMYIAGNKMRGDFTTTDTKGKTYEGSIINDGSYMYTWNSLMKTGMKIALTKDIKEQSEEAQNNPNEVIKEMNKKMKVSCKRWIKDISKFTPPSNIQFSNMSNLINTTKQQPPKDANLTPPKADTSAPCGVCDSIPDETAKAACKTNLKCN